MNFRTLKANEIDLRIGGVYPSGVTLLLYKDARVDMQILDETVGAENWQRNHYECKGNLFCSVGVKTENGWVFKDDCGTESFTEAVKGESSDSFKRACTNWGIGRELYTSPFIFIPLSKDYYDEKYPDKLSKKTQKMFNAMTVSEIGYNEKREINRLVIVDKDGTVVWQM